MYNIYTHFGVLGFSNSYFISDRKTKDAFIVDPSHFDTKVLTKIEKHGFKIKDILITHGHKAHIQGLRTLLKIYDANVYYAGEKLNDIKFIRLEEEKEPEIDILGMKVKVLFINGHSRDSVVYQFDRSLFTGDVMEAGCLGHTETPYLKAQLIKNIQEKILTLDGNYVIYPGHGPISTLDTEREHIKSLDPNKVKYSNVHSTYF